MKSVFELEVLRIEDLGCSPFTFTVWVDDILIEPTTDDYISLPSQGQFAMQVCSSDGSAGEISFQLSLVKESGSKWLPLVGEEAVGVLTEAVEGPRVLVAFTKMSILSTVVEHGSSSERSSQLSELDSPKSFKINEMTNDYQVLKKTAEDLAAALHTASVTHAETEAKLKRRVVELEHKLETMRRDHELMLRDRESMHSRRNSDQNMQIEKYRLSLKAQNAALEDVKSQLQSSQMRNKATEEVSQLKAQVAALKSSEAVLMKRGEELESQVSSLQLKLGEALDTAQFTEDRNEVARLQFQLDESEARRLTLQTELQQLSSSWEKTSSTPQQPEGLEHRQANQALVKELELLSEKLKQAQEQTIALQQQQTIWKSQIALSESSKVLRLCSNTELMTVKESAAEIEGLNRVLKEQVSSLSQELIDVKEAFTKADRELRELRNTRPIQSCEVVRSGRDLQSSYVSRVQTQPIEEDLEVYLQEFLRSYSSIRMTKSGEGQYIWGNKKLNLQLKRGQLLVKTGGGFMSLEDYLRINEADVKDYSEGSTTECSELAEDAENRSSKRNSQDFRERSVSPILDYSKPTRSSMGKRVERTPVKDARSRTPHKVIHTKRLSAKM
jgi:hypothetical protein